MSNPLDQPEIPTPVPPSTATPAAASVSQQDHQSDKRQPLAIEYNNPSKEEEVQTLDLGEGNVIKLDKLGPMIINNDGTLSRIQNWQDLHPIEQERTVRLLVKKRNLVRLKNLSDVEKAKEEEERRRLSHREFKNRTSSKPFEARQGCLLRYSGPHHLPCLLPLSLESARRLPEPLPHLFGSRARISSRSLSFHRLSLPPTR